MRAVAAFLTLALGALLVPPATVGWWTESTVVDRSAYVEAVGPVAEDPTVQELVTERVVSETTTAIGPPPAGRPALELLVSRLAAAVVAGGLFEEVWREANRDAHRQLVDALAGEPGPLELRLDSLVGAVLDRLAQRGVPLTDAVSRPDVVFEVGDSEQLQPARTAYALADDYGRVLALVCVLLLALGLVLAHRRGRALVLTSLVALLGTGLLWFVLAAGRELVLTASLVGSVPEEVAGAYFDAVTGPLDTLVLGVALACAVGVLGGAALAAVESRRWRS